MTVTSRLFLLMQSRVTLLVPPFRTASPSWGDAGGPNADMDCKGASLCGCLDSLYNSHWDVCCSPWFRSLSAFSMGGRALDGCMSLRSSNSSLFSTSASASSCLLRRSAPNRALMSDIKQDNCPWEDRELQCMSTVFTLTFLFHDILMFWPLMIQTHLTFDWAKHMRRTDRSPWAPPPRSSAATPSAPCVSSESPTVTPSLASPPPPCTSSLPCQKCCARHTFHPKTQCNLQQQVLEIRIRAYLSISTSMRSSATQLCCDWLGDGSMWPQPLGHSLRKLHSERWASRPRRSTCTGQPERAAAQNTDRT